MKTIYLIIGRTCSGKTTLAKKMSKELGMNILKSYTDRPPRAMEEAKQGDHIFLSEEEFNRIPVEDIIAYTEIKGHRYCATMQQLDDIDIYIIDPNGVECLKDNESLCEKYNFVEIYVKCRQSTRFCRYLERSDLNRDSVEVINEFKARDESEKEEFDNYEKHLLGSADIIINTDRYHIN